MKYVCLILLGLPLAASAATFDTCGGQGCERLSLPNSDGGGMPDQAADDFGMGGGFDDVKSLLGGRDSALMPSGADLPMLDDLRPTPEPLGLGTPK